VISGRTPEQRAADVLAERDAIQANLLELDGSYTKQLLDGAQLTGQTRDRWDKALATLASLWETYMAYSAVVDRIAELSGGHWGTEQSFRELTELLTGTSVLVTRVRAPLASRDLADKGGQELTLEAAVAAMRRAFTKVAKVISAVETVWTEVGGRLDAVAEELACARPLAAGLGDDTDAAFRDAEASLGSQRAAVNSDPLALWQHDQADTFAADQLKGQVAGLTARIAELDRLRAQAQRQIDELRTAAAAARAAREDAIAAWHHAADRITDIPPQPPEIAGPPMESLTSLAAAGRWTRLRDELDRCRRELAAATTATEDSERSVATALGRRDELRGLLGAYKAKAGRLGAAEDQDLADRYDQARELLWTAPCDLAAAAAAVTGYQQAILAAEGRRR
jgi:chromosome segregation ATPase